MRRSDVARERGWMSTITIEIDDERLRRLRQAAHEMNMTPDAAATMLVEEGLRLGEFPGIEFRDTDAGRQPCVAGIRMPLWHVAMVAREFGEDVSGVSRPLDRCWTVSRSSHRRLAARQ